MTRTYRTILILMLTLAAGLFATLAAHAQPVRDRLLGNVDINTTPDQIEIKVDFTFPVRYVRHYPLDVGSETRIVLEPIAINPEDRDALFKRESMSPPAGNPAHATEILYEGNVANGPYLTVLFDRPGPLPGEAGR